MKTFFLFVFVFCMRPVFCQSFIAGLKVDRVPAPSVRYFQFYDASRIGLLLGGKGELIVGDVSFGFGWGKKRDYSASYLDQKGTYGVFDVSGSVILDILYFNDILILGPQLGLSGNIYTLSAGNIFQKGDDARSRSVVFGSDTGIGLGVVRDQFGILVSAGYKWNIPSRVREQVSYVEEVYDEDRDEYKEKEVWETVSKKDRFFSSGWTGSVRVFWVFE